MPHHLLHIGLDRNPVMPRWDIDWLGEGISILPANNVRLACAFVQSYAPAIAMVDLTTGDDAELTALAEMAAALRDCEGKGDQPAKCPPIIALDHAGLTEEGRARVAQCGVDQLILAQTPCHFVRWQVRMLSRLSELSRFESSRSDVTNLAQQTREHLHDISQPLSAVLGRLQLMAAKCPPDDENAVFLNEVVKLAFEVSRRLGELQQIHRENS